MNYEEEILNIKAVFFRLSKIKDIWCNIMVGNEPYDDVEYCLFHFSDDKVDYIFHFTYEFLSFEIENFRFPELSLAIEFNYVEHPELQPELIDLFDLLINYGILFHRPTARTTEFLKNMKTKLTLMFL